MIRNPQFLNQSDSARHKRLLLARLVGSFVLLLLLSWSGYLSDKTHPIQPQHIFFLWLILSSFQVIFFRFRPNIIISLLFQLVSDLIIIGLLVYNSGGISSPLIFLLGVIIIIAGTQAHTLIVLLIAVLSSITYLIAIHIHASAHHQMLFDQHTLHILLQISLFFLTGGIMAIIAKRHAKLQLEGQEKTTQYQLLKRLHRQVLSSMQEGIIILDENMLIKDYNDASSNMITMDSNHLHQSIDTVLNIPDDVYAFIRNHQSGVFRCEIEHKPLQLLLTITSLLEENATWLVTIVNITETRKLEQQVARQDKLASIGQMASMLAHEIRNPMQSIAQAVELMGLNQKDNRLELIITDELSRLNRLVSDMLDYANPLHPNKQEVSIFELISASIAQIDLHDTYKVRVRSDKKRILLDPDHFRLVIDNLLRNAIKASPEPGSIEVDLEIKQQQWSLHVRDHGPGIHPDIENSLFEPFQTSSKHGTGLGLATVWQVCLANGWQIVVDHTVHDGALFTVHSHHLENLSEVSHG